MNLWQELKKTWLMAWNTKSVKVTSIEDTKRSEEVFDIEMPTHHNFFADDVLAHNCHQVNYEEPDNQYMKMLIFFMTANPKLRIIGGTGSPIRGKDPIIGKFWSKCLYTLSTMTLVEWGWLVPPIFDYSESDGTGYDFSSIEAERDGDSFNEKELNAIVLDNPTKTQNIMLEVVEKSKTRLGVLIFCSTKKHCAEAAKSLPEGSYGIVTDSTGYKERSKIYEASRTGKIKYLLNVGVLSTGYNNPIIDVIVYLRPLDSLTLLIQTMGRGFRIFEEEDSKRFPKIEKANCLVLDYGDVFARLGGLYDSPILELEAKQKGVRKGEISICPRCNEQNSMMARRCVGVDIHSGERCEYFFTSRICVDQFLSGVKISSGCGAENDPCARHCRIPECGNQLIDPNKKLSHTAYTDKDIVDVNSMVMIPCKNDGILVKYQLDNGVVATEFFSPFSPNTVAKRIWRSTFIKPHVLKHNIKAVNKIRSAQELCDCGLFRVPKAITHRLNEQNKSVINRRIFEEEQNG